MKRILCSLLVATLPFGRVLADAPKSKNAMVTLVYQHEAIRLPPSSWRGRRWRTCANSSHQHRRISTAFGCLLF
jgi:hypothetical protein